MWPRLASQRRQVTLRVVVVDDQTMIRQALVTLIDLEHDLAVVGEAGDVDQALEVVSRQRPDVLVLDVHLDPTEAPGRDGLSLIEAARAASPSTEVLVLTTFSRPGYLSKATRSGARGFLIKDAPVDRLLDGIRAVGAGELAIDPELAVASTVVGPSPLTERETLVLSAAARGGTTHEIAGRVYLAEGTVRNTLSSAMAKLQAPTRADAARIATDRGWLQ